MSARLLSFAWAHFGPFRELQELELPSGLILVRGSNLYSASSDDNGSGKTAFAADLPSWILFGETARGAAHDKVANRFTKGQCVGEARFVTDAGETGYIRRTRRPASATLVVGAQKWENEEVAGRVEQVFGFGFRTMLHGAMFTQGSFDRFAVADHADQMRVLDEIYGVDFKEALRKAKLWKTDWKGKLDTQTNRLQAIQAKLSELSNDVSVLEDERARFDQLQATKVADARVAVERATAACSEGKAELAHLEHLKTVLPLLTEWVEESRTLEATRRRAAQLFEARERELRTASAAVLDLQRRLDELLSGDGFCPTCLRSATGKQEASVRTAFKTLIAQATTEQDEAQERYNTARRDSVAAGQAYQDFNDPEGSQYLGRARKVGNQLAKGPFDDRMLEAWADAVATLPARRQRAAQLDAVASDAAARLKAEQQSVWANAQRLDTARTALTAAQAEEAKTKQMVKTAAATYAAADYAVEAFGDRGIRTTILYQRVAAVLQDLKAKHLQALTCGEARSNVEVAKVRGWQRLKVGVEWDFGANDPDLVSHGQDRRDALAMFAALMDLSELRTAAGFPLHVFDEPSDALDGRGRELLAEWLQAQAATRPGPTFVMTHNSEFAALLRPVAIWTVEMVGKGDSRVVV